MIPSVVNDSYERYFSVTFTVLNAMKASNPSFSMNLPKSKDCRISSGCFVLWKCHGSLNSF